MLALIEPRLRASRDRLRAADRRHHAIARRRCARFQSGDVPLFLISLKAGGIGLNLTAADTVIHYDPWWNPAVEDQATDRAHRIGQTSAVFVHRLVTIGTIEEKMEQLKARKQALVAEHPRRRARHRPVDDRSRFGDAVRTGRAVTPALAAGPQSARSGSWPCDCERSESEPAMSRCRSRGIPFCGGRGGGRSVAGKGMTRGTGPRSGTEVLAGLVERVTFHNPETGFCVLRVKARGQRDLVTVVGHAAMIGAGEFVQTSGTWVNDRTHGLQFRAGFLKASPPTTLEGIEHYLGSGMIRGIGPIYARRLVRAFGEAVFDVIEQQPERLHEVTGIGPKRAARIVAGWAEQKVIREIMLFLHANGVGTSRAVRIYKTYGSRRRAGDQREPLPPGARHPRHRLPHRRSDRREARHREDGDDPGAGRDQLRAGRGDGRGALRAAGRGADGARRQADRGARRR